MATALSSSEHNIPTTYKEIRYGKMLFRITTIGEPGPEVLQRGNDYIVQCLVNRLPELLAAKVGV